MRGNLELVSRRRIQGWLQDPDAPDRGLALGIYDNGTLIAQLVANTHRLDLERAGIGTGRYGFAFDIPGGLSPLTRHIVQVRLEHDGSDIVGSPCVIEPARSFEDGLEQAVSDAISALDGGATQQRALAFMAAQTERLQQMQADADGQRAERAAYAALQRRWGPKAPSLAAAQGLSGPGYRLRALVLDRFMPAVGRDAGSAAILSHMRALHRLGYAVSFAAVEDMLQTGQAPPRSDLTWCGAPVYASAEDVLRRQAGAFDLVYLHRVDVAARYMELVRQYMPRARIIYSVADLHHVRLARQADIEDRPDLRVRVPRIRAAELHAADGADAVITHSLDEAAWLRSKAPGARVHVVPWDVPVCQTVAPFADRHGLAFIGCFGHEPNVDAAHYLVEEVMPLVWKQDSTISCVLVGPGAPPSVRLLESARVLVMGHVEALDADVWNKVRLTVAPLRYGAGVKGKVLDSFAAGVPCAMTRVAAEGLSLPPALQDLVSDNKFDLARLICRLHAEPALNQSAGMAGQAMIRERFSAAAVDAGLRRVIESSMTVARSVMPAEAAAAWRRSLPWRIIARVRCSITARAGRRQRWASGSHKAAHVNHCSECD